MEQLRAAYELVVLDAPPALALADGDRMASAADAALLVVRAGGTPRDVVRLAVEALGERCAGVVLNFVDATGVVHGRWLYADPTAQASAPGRRAEPRDEGGERRRPVRREGLRRTWERGPRADLAGASREARLPGRGG